MLQHQHCIAGRYSDRTPRSAFADDRGDEGHPDVEAGFDRARNRLSLPARFRVALAGVTSNCISVTLFSVLVTPAHGSALQRGPRTGSGRCPWQRLLPACAGDDDVGRVNFLGDYSGPSKLISDKT